MNYRDDHVFHKEFLALLAKRMEPTCYLELGLWIDPAMIRVAPHAGICYGVDSKTEPVDPPSNSVIFRMTTDEFFDKIAEEIPPPELVFIDADHHAKQVLRDIEGVSRIAADNCIVVLHDTFPQSKMATHDGLCADSWIVPSRLHWENVTLPFPPGLTILRMRPKGFEEWTA